MRDALRRLEAEGLVTIAPRSGATVREFSPDEIIDLYMLRSSLEPNIAAVAAERRSSADLAAMRARNERLQQLFAKHGDENPEDVNVRRQLADLDYQFHKALVQGAHSRVLSDEYSRLQVWLTLFRQSPPRGLRFPSQFFQKPKKVVADHEAIVAAIEKRDSAKARQAMENHLAGLSRAANEWLHSVAVAEPA
ncbi:hypothetical protein OPIT5_23695 [Opitutaceae bacterium TAV5]|nr:hypothetical protein OPIT5_23695 [Opitutaceae bacterium TAV5]